MRGREAHLVVTSGPGAGQSLRLAPGASAILGRGSEASLSIDDPKVSRRHLLLENRDQGLWLQPVGKRTVDLDGRAIPRDGVLVSLAATLQLGGARLSIRIASPPPDLPGFRIEEKLGEGAGGEVFAAWQDPPGRRVALKALPRDADLVARKRAGREALLGLDHPGIVRILGVVEDGARLFLVRELVSGRSLADDLAKGALSAARVASIGTEVARALAHAHERGVIHRDVKPSNIIIDERSGEAKLADFENARLERAPISRTKLTKTGDLLGTLAYAAPEQVEDARRASERSDVYGLGASLYHALSGEAPFARVSPDEYLFAVLGSGPIPIDELAPRAPSKLRALITRCLDRDPRNRPDASALVRELSALAAK